MPGAGVAVKLKRARFFGQWYMPRVAQHDRFISTPSDAKRQAEPPLDRLYDFSRCLFSALAVCQQIHKQTHAENSVVDFPAPTGLLRLGRQANRGGRSWLLTNAGQMKMHHIAEMSYLLPGFLMVQEAVHSLSAATPPILLTVQWH